MVERPNPPFTPEHLRFLNYLRAVGTGPKGNRHLSGDEIKDALNLILERRVPDSLIGAFLVGWRVQGESTEELQGGIDLLAERMAPFRREGIEVGYPMDGKAKFPPLMLAAASLLSDLDVHTAVDVPLGPKYGASPESFAPFSSNVRLHPRRELNPPLSALSGLRNDLGLRSAFNTLEKLNFLAPTALIGMHHAPYFDLYATLYRSHYDRLVIVQGHEGSPDILKKTRYRLIESDSEQAGIIDPEAFGILPITAKEEVSADAMRELLYRPDANLVKMQTLNAAFLGWTAGRFPSIEEGFRRLTPKGE